MSFECADHCCSWPGTTLFACNACPSNRKSALICVDSNARSNCTSHAASRSATVLLTGVISPPAATAIEEPFAAGACPPSATPMAVSFGWKPSRWRCSSATTFLRAAPSCAPANARSIPLVGRKRYC
eukprot:5100730-Prymnesium_polylepis.3